MTRHAVFCALALAGLVATAFGQPNERKFTFTYAFTVRSPHQGKRLRVWFPKAHSDSYQKVTLISSKGDLDLKKSKESEYGNEIFYAETPIADKDEYPFEATYQVVRYERLGLQEAKLHTSQVSPAALRRFLAPDKLVPVTGEPAQIAAKEVEGKNAPLEKARAIYEYVFRTMKYDKSGTGWGRGDAAWACDAKRGNCTDFHSLFASMARSQAIPTRFEIGFPLPADKHEGDIAGYHCWSDFYVQNDGWIPIDISEAWKHPEKKNYFFGSHDVNRVQFSIGRDITLNPRQEGDALNYFVYPYVESDGQEFINVTYDFSFKDAGQPANQAQMR